VKRAESEFLFRCYSDPWGVPKIRIPVVSGEVGAFGELLLESSVNARRLVLAAGLAAPSCGLWSFLGLKSSMVSRLGSESLTGERA
jgi:hypothetical protein